MDEQRMDCAGSGCKASIKNPESAEAVEALGWKHIKSGYYFCPQCAKERDPGEVLDDEEILIKLITLTHPDISPADIKRILDVLEEEGYIIAKQDGNSGVYRELYTAEYLYDMLTACRLREVR
jgi:hypothetical protein